MRKVKTDSQISSIEVHVNDGRTLQIKASEMRRFAEAALLGLRAAVAGEALPKTKFDKHFDLLEEIISIPRNDLGVAILGVFLEQRKQRKVREEKQEGAAVRRKLMAKLGVSESRRSPR